MKARERRARPMQRKYLPETGMPSRVEAGRPLREGNPRAAPAEAGGARARRDPEVATWAIS